MAVVGVIMTVAQIWGKPEKKDYSDRITRITDQLNLFYSPLMGRLDEPDSRKQDYPESFIREKFSQCQVITKYKMYAEPDSSKIISKFYVPNALIKIGEWNTYFDELYRTIKADYIKLKTEFDEYTQ